MKKTIITTILWCVPFLAAILCLILVVTNNHQAQMAVLQPQQFIGEYSIDGKSWNTIDYDTKIPSYDGGVILRGHFKEEIPEGGKLNFYENHIGVSVYVNGEMVYISAMQEIEEYFPDRIDVKVSMCGNYWSGFISPGITNEDEVEIHLTNPHKYGNSTAYSDFLNSMCNGPISLDILSAQLKPYSMPMQICGMVMVIIAIMLIGASLVSLVLRVKMGSGLFRYGLASLFSGLFIMIDTVDFSLKNELIVFNTYSRLLCMMLAALCFGLCAVEIISGKKKRVLTVGVAIAGALDVVFFVLSFSGVALLYDIFPLWVITQLILCPILFVCSLLEMKHADKSRKYFLVSHMLLAVAVMLDLFGVGASMLSQATCFKVCFIMVMLFHIVRTAKQVIVDYQRARKVKQLEQELEDSRIAIMLSQIQPHFIYNTLGTIGGLCEEEPKKASDLVQKFSLYLRGNFTELDNPSPIRLAKEMEHVKHYVSIEQIRFPDIEVEFDIQAENFMIPALTIQPLVENAIKHGLMGLESGGEVKISTYESDKHYEVCVKDNGVGFDDSAFEDGRKHIGIKNIKKRIEGMCNGILIVDSTVGAGTIAIIKIPKEGVTNDSTGGR